MPEHRIRVILIDDHAIVRMGLSSIIDGQPDMHVVAQFEHPEHAVEYYKEMSEIDNEPADVLLIDQRLPGMDGIDLFLALQNIHGPVNAIIVTTYETEADIQKAFKVGIKGYMFKDALNDDIIDAVRIVHSGGNYVPPAVAAYVRQPRERPNLSPREVEVLKLLSQGMSNKEIAHRLDVSESTARTHVEHILSKLGVTDRTLAVTTALQRGIIRLGI